MAVIRTGLWIAAFTVSGISLAVAGGVAGGVGGAAGAAAGAAGAAAGAPVPPLLLQVLLVPPLVLLVAPLAVLPVV